MQKIKPLTLSSARGSVESLSKKAGYILAIAMIDDLSEEFDYWLESIDEDEPIDELEQWLGGRCGFIPDLGTCDLAGSEECDFDCPLRDDFYQLAR